MFKAPPFISGPRTARTGAQRAAVAWWAVLCLAMRAVLLWCAGAACAQTVPTVVVQDDRGTEHRFTAPPRRIVSLLPSLTESVWALGGGPLLVGVDRYSDWPAQVGTLPRLGGLDDTQIETITTLKPDVVLASTAARSLDRLEVLGLKVLRLKSETHADVQRTLRLLATLLGTPAEGDRLWQRIQHDVAAASARVPARLRGQRVYFELGGGPYAAGRSSFIGETLAVLGLDNIVPAALGPFPKLNPEYVVRAQPQLVMGPLREQAAMAARPGWQHIPAIVNQQRCGFDAKHYDVLVRPGPRLGEAAGLLADCLLQLPRVSAAPGVGANGASVSPALPLRP